MYALTHALHGTPLPSFEQIPFDPEPPRRAIPPMSRWWCVPAVELTRICVDCCNSKAPGLDRCRPCDNKLHEREAKRVAYIADLYDRRGQACIDGDLALALRIDDTLECVYDMHADGRMTCYQCQTWCDHAHHPITNETMTPEQWDAYTAARPGIYGRR